MSGKKNGGYGCGTVVAILVILSFLAEFVPVAATISVIVVICALIYKKITDGKGNSNNNIQTSNSYELNKDLEKSTNESASVSQSDDIYRKNKVISEQNFEISEKNEIIDKLNKKLKEQTEKFEKTLSEKNDLILKQKLDISNLKLENLELKNDLESKKEYIQMDDLDPYTWEAALYIVDREKCSPITIQQRFRISYERSEKIIKDLYSIGAVGIEQENGARMVILNKYTMTELHSKLIDGTLEKRVENEDDKKDILIRKLNHQISDLKNIVDDKNSTVMELEKNIENLKNEIGEIDEQHSKRRTKLENQFQNEFIQYEEKRRELKDEINDIKEELKILNNEAIEAYYYFSDYSNITSQECLNQLSLLKAKESELRRTENDVEIFDDFEKRKVIERTIRQMLRNFNSDCDNILMNIKIKNMDSVRSKIIKSYETMNKLYSADGVSLTEDILSIKLEQATLLYDYEMKCIEEKEIQQAIKEKMIEEAKAEREIEQQKKKIDKDLEQHTREVNRIMKYMQKTQIDAERQLYIDKIKELEDKIKTLQADKETVMEREANAKAGFVYVISNIGSFGKNIYKIGMTRRLEPMERIRELSSASVPFEFDVHAMIFSSDAPDLENTLHKRFSDMAVNKVNPRKEFYQVDIDEIEKVVKENYNDTVQFTKIPVAAEYRKSLEMSTAIPLFDMENKNKCNELLDDSNKSQLEKAINQHGNLKYINEETEGEEDMYDKEKGIYPSGSYVTGRTLPLGQYVLTAKNGKDGSVSIYENYLEFKDDNAFLSEDFSEDYFLSVVEAGNYVVISNADVQKV